MKIFITVLVTVLSFATMAFAQYEQYAPENEGALRMIQAGEYKAALEILVPLAETGDARAQSNLGVLYDHGYGLARDIEHAANLFRMAAEQGFAPAQSNLGNLYNRGEGVPHDDTMAVVWYRRAAVQGYANAQNSLGIMYGRGDGVDFSTVNALMWFIIAARSGNTTAGENHDKLLEHMNPAEISEAQKMAENCIESQFRGCR